MAVPEDRDSRLVYSTGGELPRREGEASAPAATLAKAGIRLRLERRASGRVVTALSGLPGTAAEIEALARELKRACGAGGNVKEGILEMQGDQRQKLEAVLRSRGLRFKRAAS